MLSVCILSQEFTMPKKSSNPRPPAQKTHRMPAFNRELREIVSQLLDKLFIIVVSAGSLAILGAMAHAWLQGGSWLHLTHLAIFVTALVFLTMRRHLPFPFLAIALLLLIAIDGACSLYVFALAGQGLIAFGCVSILVGIFFGKKPGMITLAGLAVLTAGFGLGICRGWILPPAAQRIYGASLWNWASVLAVFVFFTMIILESISSIQRKLFRSLDETHAFSRELQASNEKLGQEIAQRQVKEHQLFRSEEMYRHLAAAVEQAEEVFIITNQAGTILYVNPALQRISGYSAQEVVGRSIDAFGNGATPAEVRDEMWQAMHNGLGWRGRGYSKRKDGTAYTEEVSVSPMRDAGGVITGYVMARRDITEQLELEEKLRHSEKLQAIGQLAGGIAHDFNNQLTGILGNAELIRVGATDRPDITQFAREISLSAQSSAEMTRKLLAFARKGRLQYIPVNLHEILGEVVTMLSHSVDKRIKIKQRLDAIPPITMGDPSQLQNAFLNLGINARDAMPQGGELIFATDVVELSQQHFLMKQQEIPPGTYLQVRVIDSGAGMSPEILRHLFEPFFTTKEPGKGTGMGLAAVYGTVKSHKGAIEATSDVGRGSTFIIYLPVADLRAGSRERAPEMPIRAAHGLQVLLVDDEEIVCKAAVNMLKMLGHTVTVCHNGEEALQHYRNAWRAIDLVILDMVMPEMNGRDTYRAMRGINQNVVALLSTGYSLEKDAEAILSEGVKSFIQKPFTIAELSRKIGVVTGR
jgi:PAS domain S-box-containing protein